MMQVDNRFLEKENSCTPCNLDEESARSSFFGTTKRRNPFGEQRRTINGNIVDSNGDTSNFATQKVCESTFATLMSNAQINYSNNSREGFYSAFDSRSNFSEGLGFFQKATNSSLPSQNASIVGAQEKANENSAMAVCNDEKEVNSVASAQYSFGTNDEGVEMGMCFVCMSMSAYSPVPCAHCGRSACEMCLRQCESCQDMFCSFCTTVNYASRYDRIFCFSCNNSSTSRGFSNSQSQGFTSISNFSSISDSNTNSGHTFGSRRVFG